MPGVSTKTTCALARFNTPSMEVRVVCGFSDTMASLPPTMAFKNVDFPAFGRPRMETKPERNSEVGALIDDSATASLAGLSRREPVLLLTRRRPGLRCESHPVPRSHRRAEHDLA